MFKYIKTNENNIISDIRTVSRAGYDAEYLEEGFVRVEESLTDELSLLGKMYTPENGITESEGSIRNKRDSILIAEVDPIVNNPLRWASLSSEEQLKVTNYRTSLLDITEQTGFPTTINWPTKP
jgi:hypothetical protein